MKLVLKSTLLSRKFGVLSKDFAAKSPKIIENVTSSSSPSVIYDYISKQSSFVCHSWIQIIDKVLQLLQIALDQQINIYHMGRLFTTDEEDNENKLDTTTHKGKWGRQCLAKYIIWYIFPLNSICLFDYQINTYCCFSFE